MRNLERSVGSVCRVVAYKYAISEDPETFKQITVDSAVVQDALGNNTADTFLHERIQCPGTAIGLAYTSNGGRALLIETTKYPGTGRLVLTGQLGDVMKESVGTALSWIRSNAAKLGLIPNLIPPKGRPAVNVVNSEEENFQISNFMSRFDIHVHFPAAAVPKDGPSAGVTITVALVSLFTGRRVKSDFAMTGEVSL